MHFCSSGRGVRWDGNGNFCQCRIQLHFLVAHAEMDGSIKRNVPLGPIWKEVRKKRSTRVGTNAFLHRCHYFLLVGGCTQANGRATCCTSFAPSLMYYLHVIHKWVLCFFFAWSFGALDNAEASYLFGFFLVCKLAHVKEKRKVVNTNTRERCGSSKVLAMFMTRG